MTKPQDTSLEANHARSEDTLVKHLQALQQPEPSPELDAAILEKIEHALKQEAVEILQTQAQTQTQAQPALQAALVKRNSRESLFQTLERKLRQLWFVPAGALAVILVSVTLNRPSKLSEPTANMEIMREAQPLKGTAADQNEQAEAIMKRKRDEVAADASASNSRMDSKNLALNNSVPLERKSHSKNVDKANEIANADASLPESRTRLEVANASAKIPASANTHLEPGSNQVPREAESTVASASSQSVEMSGTRSIQSSVESSQAVQVFSREEPQKESVAAKPDLRALADQPERNALRALPKPEFAKIAPPIVVASAPPPPPLSVIAAVKAVEPRPVVVQEPAAPMASAPALSPAKLAAEEIKETDRQNETLERETTAISERLELLLRTHRPRAALALWKKFKESHTQVQLHPDLQKQLEQIERQEKPKRD